MCSEGGVHERCAGGIVQDEGLEPEGIRERFKQAQHVQGVVSTAIGVVALNETRGRMFCPTLRDTASTDTMVSTAVPTAKCTLNPKSRSSKYLLQQSKSSSRCYNQV